MVCTLHVIGFAILKTGYEREREKRKTWREKVLCAMIWALIKIHSRGLIVLLASLLPSHNNMYIRIEKKVEKKKNV